MDENSRYGELMEIQRRMEEEFGLDLRMDDCLNMKQQRNACRGTDSTESLPARDTSPYRSTRHSRRKRTFFKECAIAGWNFHIDHDLWQELETGMQLALIRDRKNRHDRNAVAVALANDYDGNPYNFDLDLIIGYVPRTENLLIAQMMDMGWNDVFAAELTTIKGKGNFDDRLRMTIYIQNKEEQENDSDNRLYAMMMDDESLEYVTSSLLTKGSVYFRWGGFPSWEMDLPETGDKVLLLQQRNEETVIYLMHIMAKDEQAAPFLDNPEEELNRVDDCCAYILTNIMGPINISRESIEFLEKESIGHSHPEGHLSEETAERLKTLLRDLQ